MKRRDLLKLIGITPAVPKIAEKLPVKEVINLRPGIQPIYNIPQIQMLDFRTACSYVVYPFKEIKK